METWMCAKCGTENDVGSRYCEKCGNAKKDNNYSKKLISDNPYAKLAARDIECRIADGSQKYVALISLGAVGLFIALIMTLFSKAVRNVLFIFSVVCFFYAHFIRKDTNVLKEALNIRQRWEKEVRKFLPTVQC